MKKAPAIIPAQNPGGDVYALVLCLSAAEKTTLRKAWDKGFRKQPLHIQLFEAITDRKIFDDAGAQKSLGLSGGAQFSNLKQYLANEVLDALIHSQRDNAALTQLHFGLMQLRLLAERSQTALARKLCKKLWAIAEDTGQYGFAVELLYQKSRLLEQRSFRQYASEADEIAALIERYTGYHQASRKIRSYTERLSLLRAADSLGVADEQHEAVQAVMTGLLAFREQATATPQLRFRYSAALGMAAYMLQQFDRCSVCCEDMLALLEAAPHLVGSDPESFLTVANIAFYNGFALDAISRVSGSLSQFDHLANIADNNAYFHKRWAIIRFNTTVKIAHKTGDYEGVARLVDRQGTTILGYASLVLPPAEALSVFTSIVISFFVLERFAAAEALMLEVKERNRSLDRQDVFYFTLVFHLLILYELKDWYRLDSATEAAYHALYNRKKLRPFERELMRFLKALPARRGRSDNAAFIRAFADKLEVYRTDPVQRLYFLYFNYYDWLQSKLAGVSYREYKRRLLTATV